MDNSTKSGDSTTKVVLKLIDLTQRHRIVWTPSDYVITDLSLTNTDIVQGSFVGEYHDRLYRLTKIVRRLGLLVTWSTPLSGMLGEGSAITRTRYVLSVLTTDSKHLKTYGDVPAMERLYQAIGSQLVDDNSLFEESDVE